MKNCFKCLLLVLWLPNASMAQQKLLTDDEISKSPNYTNLDQAFKKYNEVYRLTLRGAAGYYGKVDAIHHRIDSLKNLQSLTCVNEAIEVLPPAIGNLKNLQHLLVSGNKLKSLPDTLFTLKNLKRLDIRANQFKKIPEKISKLTKLEYLYINDNRELDYLPIQEIVKLKNLKVINAKNTKIPREQLIKLKSLMPNSSVDFD